MPAFPAEGLSKCGPGLVSVWSPSMVRIRLSRQQHHDRRWISYSKPAVAQHCKSCKLSNFVGRYKIGVWR